MRKSMSSVGKPKYPVDPSGVFLLLLFLYSLRTVFFDLALRVELCRQSTLAFCRTQGGLWGVGVGFCLSLWSRMTLTKVPRQAGVCVCLNYLCSLKVL